MKRAGDFLKREGIFEKRASNYLAIRGSFSTFTLVKF